MGCQQKSLKQRAIPRFESTENWRQIIAVYKLPLNYFNYFKRLQKTRPPSPHPNKFLAVPGKFWGIVGQDPNEPKSNRLHVGIFWFCFIQNCLSEVYCVDSFKMIGKFHEVLNFNRLSLGLNRLICN